jgi:negative regulator of sigma E activity
MIYGIAVLLALALPLQAKAPARPDPLDLLRSAAAGPRTSYSGEVSVSRPGPDGKKTVSRMLVHFSPPNLYRRELLGRGGKLRLLVVEDGETEWVFNPNANKVWRGEQSDLLFKRFGPEEELDRLKDNYDAALAAGGRLAGRLCWKIELKLRSDGTLARRLWIDRDASLVLRSESYAPDGALLEATRFSKISFNPSAQPGLFKFSPPSGAAIQNRAEPDFLALNEAKTAGVEPKVPTWLPAGFVFESLDVLPKGRNKLVHYRFSDGIRAISLFQSPAGMNLDFGGRQKRPVKLSAGSGDLTEGPEGDILSWTKGAWRFVLVGPVTPDCLAHMAESLP